MLCISPTLFPFNCIADDKACGSPSSSSDSSSSSSSARVTTLKKTTPKTNRTKNFIFALSKKTFLLRFSFRSNGERDWTKKGQWWKMLLQLKSKLTFFSHFLFEWREQQQQQKKRRCSFNRVLSQCDDGTTECHWIYSLQLACHLAMTYRYKLCNQL